MMTGHLLAWIQKLAVQHFYRPQRSCGQGSVFTRVCHSVHSGGGGVCLSACWDTRGYPGADPREQTPPKQTPPWEQTPPERTPPSPQSRPPGADPPGADTCPPQQTPPPLGKLQHSHPFAIIASNVARRTVTQT